MSNHNCVEVGKCLEDSPPISLLGTEVGSINADQQIVSSSEESVKGVIGVKSLEGNNIDQKFDTFHPNSSSCPPVCLEEMTHEADEDEIHHEEPTEYPYDHYCRAEEEFSSSENGSVDDEEINRIVNMRLGQLEKEYNETVNTRNPDNLGIKRGGALEKMLSKRPDMLAKLEELRKARESMLSESDMSGGVSGLDPHPEWEDFDFPENYEQLQAEDSERLRKIKERKNDLQTTNVADSSPYPDYGDDDFNDFQTAGYSNLTSFGLSSSDFGDDSFDWSSSSLFPSTSTRGAAEGECGLAANGTDSSNFDPFGNVTVSTTSIDSIPLQSTTSRKTPSAVSKIEAMAQKLAMLGPVVPGLKYSVGGVGYPDLSAVKTRVRPVSPLSSEKKADITKIMKNFKITPSVPPSPFLEAMAQGALSRGKAAIEAYKDLQAK